jgi:hypothetical protein
VDQGRSRRVMPIPAQSDLQVRSKKSGAISSPSDKALDNDRFKPIQAEIDVSEKGASGNVFERNLFP